MEGPAPMSPGPCPDVCMLIGSVVVEDDMDGLFFRNVSLDPVQEADKRLMPAVLHCLAHNLTRKRVESGKQGCCPMALVIMGHRLTTTLSERQARLGAVRRLYLALLVEAKYPCMGGG